MSYARKEDRLESPPKDTGRGRAVAAIAVIFVCMALVGIAASSLRETPRSATITEPSPTHGIVATARASRTPAMAAAETDGFPLSVPAGTPYPEPAESATSGNATDMTY